MNTLPKSIAFYYCIFSKDTLKPINHSAWFIGLFLIFILCHNSMAQKTDLSQIGVHLIPYPQEVSLGGSDYIFSKKTNIVVDTDATEKDQFTFQLLSQSLTEDFKITTSVSTKAGSRSIILSRKNAPNELGEEGYLIKVSESKITVNANGEAGLFYGVQTLLQLIQKNTNTFVKGMEIKDWPDTPQRAAHYDTKHHQDKKEYVKSFIRDLAKYKMNMLVWEWEDKFAYPSHPEIGAPGAFSMEEMQELSRYAQQYHVQMVPLVQGLGHVSFILKWPQFAHLREIPASNWEFCPLKEGTYELLFDLWEDAIEATPGSKFIHIGSDETFELGQGPDCGEKAKEIGNSGVYHLFVNRATEHLKSLGREVMVWERPMGWKMSNSPAKGISPIKDVILTESYDYETEDFQYAKEAKELGYKIYAYDPNPGLEQMFLPYFFRKNRDKKVKGSLERSYDFLTTNIGSGLFYGMINTSWDDAGLHNQVWMLSFVTSAEYSWSASNPGLEEFTAKFFYNYYGNDVTEMKKLFTLLNEGGYFYKESFERKVWHHANVGKTHLPDLPRADAMEYDPYWNQEYAERVKRARVMNDMMNEAIAICEKNMTKADRNIYDFEVFASIAELIQHTAQTYMDLSDLENAITAAHKQRFLSHSAAFQHLGNAKKILENSLERRAKVFSELVATWEKVRLPKGMSTTEKSYFFQQDRAYHFANRRPDMAYLIHDEELLGMENYLSGLEEYISYYKDSFLRDEILNQELPAPNR